MIYCVSLYSLLLHVFVVEIKQHICTGCTPNCHKCALLQIVIAVIIVNKFKNVSCAVYFVAIMTLLRQISLKL